jgi:ketosteroid isomerase-like protein
MNPPEIDFAKGSQLLEAAYALAARAHADQHEEFAGQPYISHPVEVARLLYAAGYDDEVVAAGLLHDVLEQSDLTVAMLEARCGPRVARLVAALTEPPLDGDFAERKAALREQIAGSGADAEAIFAADKVAKSASLRRAILQLGGDEVDRRVEERLELKLDHYQASLDLLERVAADLPFVAQLHEQLESIEQLRANDGDYEIARRAIDAINRRDDDALIDICDEQVEWWPALTLGASGEPYRGPDGLRAYLRDIDRTWTEFHVELDDIRAITGRLLAVCTIRTVGRRPRIRLHRRAVIVCQLGGGRVRGARTLLDPVAAQAAARA